MDKNYIYNTDTHKLHIKGYCRHGNSAGSPPFLFFETENEVAERAWKGYTMCKYCSKKRDQILSDLSKDNRRKIK